MKVSEIPCTKCGHTFFEHEGDGDSLYPCETDDCGCLDFGQPIWPAGDGRD